MSATPLWISPIKHLVSGLFLLLLLLLYSRWMAVFIWVFWFDQPLLKAHVLRCTLKCFGKNSEGDVKLMACWSRSWTDHGGSLWLIDTKCILSNGSLCVPRLMVTECSPCGDCSAQWMLSPQSTESVSLFYFPFVFFFFFFCPMASCYFIYTMSRYVSVSVPLSHSPLSTPSLSNVECYPSFF